MADMEERLETRLTERIDEVVKKRVDEVVTKRLGESEERIRRHFDIMVERFDSTVKLVAEVNAHHSTILDNHELRLKKTEKRRA